MGKMISVCDGHWICDMKPIKSMAIGLPIYLATNQKPDIMHLCSMWFQSIAILLWFITGVHF